MYDFCIDWLCNELFSVRFLFFLGQSDRMGKRSSLSLCTVVIINIDIALFIYKSDYLCVSVCECFFFSPWEISFLKE